jgi:phage shock protein A
MFRRIREKIERALERREAERPLTRDELRHMLSGMRQELIEMRTRIPRLEKEADRLAARAQQQIQRAELAHAKAQEADRAGNLDGGHRALEMARQALSDVETLRTQEAETREELERLKVEYEDKLEQLKDAERGRSALLARARRAGTARKLDEMLRGPESGVQKFERAEEDIDAAEDLAAAERELAEALGERQPVREIETDVELRRLEAAKEADEVERRLAELKRQIEEEEK